MNCRYLVVHLELWFLNLNLAFSPLLRSRFFSLRECHPGEVIEFSRNSLKYISGKEGTTP